MSAFIPSFSDMTAVPQIGEGDWLQRTARVVRRAISVFGEDRARLWLCTPLQRFDDRTPEDMLVTVAGGQEVEELLGHLDHGAAA